MNTSKFLPFSNDQSHETGPFDIIGDVHGCFHELRDLLLTLGYIFNPNDTFSVSHPADRKLIFVGDLVDRGPDSPQVLRCVMEMVKKGIAFSVLGNHDDKLKRKLQGSNVIIAHGLAESLEQFENETPLFKEEVSTFIDGLNSYLIFDDGKLIVSHAGIKEEDIGRNSQRIRAFCMYGQITDQVDAFGLPIRYPWAKDYKGNALIVYGHTPVKEPLWLNKTLNIDTGCVFGGKLTAFRYPEKKLISIPAVKKYCTPLRPIETGNPA
jgi:protein phosphatase